MSYKDGLDMSYLKTKGIVIREVNTGEADKVLTVFTRTNGKISMLARGARRPRSSMVAGTQLLCYSDFVLFKGKELYTVNNCEAIEPFYDIRNNIVKLTYSAHMLELLNDAVQENQPAGRVLQLFLNTMHLLSNTERQPELLTRIFELRLMSLMGYAPYAKGCVECGKDDNEIMAFSFKHCGYICRNGPCSDTDPGAVDISAGTARAIRHVIYSKMTDLFNFNVSDDVLNELSGISRRYVRERMEKEYTKLDFLKEIKL